MKTLHTPAPWHIHGDNKEIHANNDSDGEYPLCDIDPENLFSPEKRKEIACLIASAPELLEALQAAHEVMLNYQDYKGSEPLTDEEHAVYSQVLQAISKATGVSQDN